MPPRVRKKEQGVLWVSSTGDTYKDSDIDIDTIRRLSVGNVYARGLWKKLKNMVFNQPPTIEVFDEEGESDEELSNTLEQMFEDADLWESMQKSFMDVFFFGAALFNPVWDDFGDGNGVVLVNLRRLPPYSFNNAGAAGLGYSLSQQYHGLLNGIVWDKDKDAIRYFQTDEFDTEEITNIMHVKEPDSDSLAGDPVIYPLVPVIEMLKFAWNSNMQTVNRIGAPVVFIKITNPRPTSASIGGVSDADYAKSIIQNWGKDTAFTLRENMELLPLNISEGDVSGRIIDQLEKLLLDHISPAKFVTKTGTLIGGSTESEGEMMEAYVRGQHTWLCGAFEELLNDYFKFNAFPDGYYCRINIPITLPGQTTTSMNQAQIGYSTKTLDTNEIRSLLGFEPLDDESLQKLRDEYAAAMPSPFGSPFGQGEEGASKNDKTKGATELEQMQFGKGLTTLVYQTPVKEAWDQRKAGQLAKTLDSLLQELGDEVVNIVEAPTVLEHGDLPGHPFRGNQWAEGTGGIGATPYLHENDLTKIPLDKNERAKVMAYKELDWEKINTSLRAGKDDAASVKGRELIQIIEKAPKIPAGATIYRAVNAHAAMALADANIGMEFEDRGIQSFTADKAQIEEHNRPRIRNFEGTKVEDIVILKSQGGGMKGIYIPSKEKEVIIPPSKWKIVDREVTTSTDEKGRQNVILLTVEQV